MWQPRVRVHNGVPFRVGSSLRPNKCMNTGHAILTCMDHDHNPVIAEQLDCLPVVIRQTWQSAQTCRSTTRTDL